MKYFEPTFESLHEFKAPEWFRDAKFGIWSHWGPQSVPMFGDWYARKMYEEGSPQYLYHLRHYGHPSKFGYKDICALWKAESFDADALMDLYVKAGAKYFAAQATHHDNFFNYDSKINRMNSVNIGPHKDICALWQQAALKRGVHFGITEHLAASFTWWRFNKGADKYGPFAGVPYDGNDPEYRDFYHDNYEHVTSDPNAVVPWTTLNKKFYEYWLNSMYEIIDKFSPEFLYSDSSLPFGTHWERPGSRAEDDPDYTVGMKAVAKLYNASIDKYGENRAFYLQKNTMPEIYNVGILDIERSLLPEIAPYVWNTDTCIGNWFYNASTTYKRPAHIIGMLVDIISKNGNLLLNIVQRPDGSIDDETRYILDELAKWNKVCAEGVYGTRPWKVFGEGSSRINPEGHKEEITKWQSDDVRYTKKDGIVYAFLMGAKPGQTVVLKEFANASVSSVRLLGAGEIEFTKAYDVLCVKLPEQLPTEYVNCIAIK